ncbi:MAG: hypothetical protein K0R88_2132 [Solirubrobacterales bacterium]|jgi:hypothetical protein|nr:hypothetical protein [Solirubrobacterales bacterium]
MAHAGELDMDVRVLWLHAFVLWLEHEPVLDETVRSGFGRRSSACRFRGTPVEQGHTGRAENLGNLAA